MKIDAIVFDMDGVLTKSMQYHIESWKYAFNKFKIYPNDEDIALLEGMSYKETIKTISKKYSTKLNKKKQEEIYILKKSNLTNIFQYNIYPKVFEILELIKKNKIKLALVSGANKDFVNNLVNKYFQNYFNVIITGSDVLNGKPHPEPFLKALEKLQIPSEKAVVIENSPLGVASAKKANILTYAITTTLDKRYLQKADKIIYSHKELFNEIKKITQDK